MSRELRISMDDLTHTLRQLCLRNRDGSFATQASRQDSLALMARQLRKAGFCQMRANCARRSIIRELGH
jgi:Tfp pilus assembly protein PilW